MLNFFKCVSESIEMAYDFTVIFVNVVYNIDLFMNVNQTAFLESISFDHYILLFIIFCI